MKILIISPSYFPAIQYGGPIFTSHLLNKTLVKNGVEVYVFTTNSGLKDRKDIELNKWIDLDGVKVKYFPSYFYENFTFSPALFFSTLKNVKDFDLVYMTFIWNFTTIAGSIACRLKNKPYVISPRGTLYKETVEIKSSIIKKLYLKLFGKSFLEKANAIHYTTLDEKENVENYLDIHAKSIIIGHGEDLSRYENLPERNAFKNKYSILKDKKYILFLSRISKKKGLDLLIPAFKKLSEDFPELYLVIAGPDNEGYKIEVEVWIAEYNLSDRVIFTGLLSGDEKISAYIDAEVFVLPSYSENFGMVVIEAMACHIPIVISNKVGIYKEVEEYNAGIVTETTIDSVCIGMKKTLENKDLKENLLENAKKLLKEKYDIENITMDMIVEFKKIIDTVT